MSQRNHTRSSSHGRLLPTHTRPSKPALHRRGQSYNHANGQAIRSRPSLGGTKKVGVEIEVEGSAGEDDDAGFLQFCTTCEKQIISPGTSILYCSEACRKRDANKPLSMQMPALSPPITASASTHHDFASNDILPQRSPTVLRPASLTFSDFTLSESGSPTSDLDDQTLHAPTDFTHTHHHHANNTTANDSTCTPRRRTTRTSTNTDSTLPSLTHTPSSSIGTVASTASYRPLPPRRDPSAELVTPFYSHQRRISTGPASPTQLMSESSSLKSSASTLTSFHVAEAEDLSFARTRGSRRESWRRSGPSGGT